MDSFHTRLRQLAKTCEFGDIDKEIKEHIILTCSSNSLRRRALRENLTLEALLKLGSALELSETQARQVEKTESDVNQIKSNETNRQSRPCQRIEKSSRSRYTNRSHAIVTTQTSDPVHRGNAEIAVDMHLTGINVQPEEKPAMHVEKLVILLIFAYQNPELWLV